MNKDEKNTNANYKTLSTAPNEAKVVKLASRVKKIIIEH